jgi:hypothetical protein
MARGAIDGNLALRVTAEAITHIQVHRADGGGLLRHIAMAVRAGYSGADVRRMIEANVGRGTVIVYAHPGNILAARLVSRDFLDLRAVRGDHLMAVHAELHTGNSGFRTLAHARMANLALQTFGEMSLVREGDGLNGLGGMALEKIGNGSAHAIVRRRENGISLGLLRCTRVARCRSSGEGLPCNPSGGAYQHNDQAYLDSGQRPHVAPRRLRGALSPPSGLRRA